MGTSSGNADYPVSRKIGKASTLKTAPAFSFGSKYRSIRDNGVPGPGTYGSQDPVMAHPAGHGTLSWHRSQPAVTFQGKPFASRPPQQPGPSDYNPKEDPLRRSAPVISFHGSEQKDSRRSYPGPGHYVAETSFTAVRPHQPAISISHRHPEPSEKYRVPGPGTYTATDYRVKEQVGVTIKFRHAHGSVHETPAPHDYADKDFAAYYSPPDRKKGITFGVRHKAYTTDAVPGPQYQVGCSTLGIAATPTLPRSKLPLKVVL